MREILVTGEKELINIRIFYSNKGFGIEVFNDLPIEKSQVNEHEQDRMQVFLGDKYVSEEEYVGIWKLDPKTRKRVKKAK